MLDLHGIVADKKIAKVLNASHGGPGFAFERGLAPADSAGWLVSSLTKT